VIYCRVSTKEQVEEGNSLSTQEKNCKEYALKNGYQIEAVFIEQGESAKTVDRTELQKLMRFCAIKKHEIMAVIAYKIDRISRNTDDYSQIRILLKRYGVEIKSTSEHFEDNPAGRFMENIIANVAQFDNDVRAERCVGGMREAVREGRYVWMAPCGYSNIKVSGKSTIGANHLAPLVKMAFEEVAKNECTADEIRKKLITQGFNPSHSKAISRSAFHRMLKNEIYTGWVSKFGERHKGAFEAIISEELFQKVQQILSGKHSKQAQYLTECKDFPLRRFFKHPSGNLFTGCWAQGRKKKYPYYLVHKPNINIRKEVLEDIFIAILNKFKMDILHFEKLKDFVKKHVESGISNKKADGEQLQQKVAQLRARQNTLIEKNIDGIIGDEFCKERIAAIDLELYQIQKLTSALPGSNINYGKLLDIIRNILTEPAAVWGKVQYKMKIKLQWFYFPHGIEFDGNESRITKICKLFNMKDQFFTFQSRLVDHPIRKSNTSNLQISLPPENSVENVIFWEELKQEIETLAEIISSAPK